MQLFLDFTIKIFVFILRVVIFVVIYNMPFMIYYFRKAKKEGKTFVRTAKKIKDRYKKTIFYRLFIAFPCQFWIDFFNKSPNDFNDYGMIIFTGKQGNGKTMAMTEYILRLQEKYEKSKCITNYAYQNENAELDDWHMLVDYTNDKLGVIVGMDELQNWFNSLQSKNFPPEMLSVVTQNRKNRRLILGTAQQFYMLSKNIRTQCTEIRKCKTVLGCLTIVSRFELEIDNSGDVKKENLKGIYFFVHNEKLRNAYDTYKVIENLAAAGFKERTENVIETHNTFSLNK